MIKRSPEDFLVEERLDPEFLKSAQAEKSPEKLFALYVLAKEGLATPEAAGRIARVLDLQPGALAYAGLKDKHASTKQYVTIRENEEAEEGPPPRAAVVEGPGWSLKRVGFVARHVAASDIARNAFRITVRNLTRELSQDIDGAAELLRVAPKDAATLRIVNYFGDQRFGSARHGQGFVARSLIKGDFETALKLSIATEARKDRMEQKLFKRTVLENWGKWREMLPKLRNCGEKRPIERLANSGGDFRQAFAALPYLTQQLSVYAYQSWLWNAIAREVIVTGCVPRGRVLEAEDVFGEMLFPTSEAVPDELRDLQLPLLAHNTELKDPWKSAAEKVLEAEGIKVSDLKIPGMRRPFFGEEPRNLFFTAGEVTIAPAKPDETATGSKRLKRQLSFTLPRGSYATVVLRALGQ